MEQQRANYTVVGCVHVCGELDQKCHNWSEQFAAGARSDRVRSYDNCCRHPIIPQRDNDLRHTRTD